MTHLSVKTLRHYHEVGLLEPATVNPSTGYRYYSGDQIPTAQVIRRLGALEMPVGERAGRARPGPAAPPVGTSLRRPEDPPGTGPGGTRPPGRPASRRSSTA